MDLSSIPAVLWYSISLAIILLSCTFSCVSINNGNMSIEAKGVKINAGLIKKDRDDLQETLRQATQLEEQYKMLHGFYQEQQESYKETADRITDDKVKADLMQKIEAMGDVLEKMQEKNENNIVKLQQAELKMRVTNDILKAANVELPSENNRANTIVLDNLWVKKGYYLSLLDGMRLLVKDVDTGSAKIEIKEGGAVLKGLSLEIEEEKIVSLKGNRYKVRLNSIGKAGYNIFTNAAYFTVIKNPR